jgi:hypothetical protein
VPVLVKFPVKAIVPEVTLKVPALTILPGTYKLPEFTLNEEPKGIVSPTA